jgi:tricorn protease-like protein
MCIGTQSKSLRFSNSNGDEIGIKFNRNKDIILLIENNKHVSMFFTFSADDDQTLNYFENILTNMISYYHTFDMNYGRKINSSDKGMAFKVMDRDGASLEVAVRSEIGIRFEIQGSDSKCVNFLFSAEDKAVLEMFKSDLGSVIKKNIAKLPPVMVNASSTAEIPRTFKDAP